jgi:4-amino-4-deoxychorismate synthase (2-amino-4-deoxychorismate-forming) component I
MLSCDNYRIIPSTGTKLDLLSLYQLDPSFYPALLESVSSNHSEKSFDILFLNPQETLLLDHQQRLHFSDNSQLNHQTAKDNNFLNAFNLLSQKPNIINDGPSISHPYYPFSGGWFVYLAYELANQIEPTLNLANYNQHMPIAYACRYSSALIYDHSKKELVIFCEQKSQLDKLFNKIGKDIARAKELQAKVTLSLLDLPEISQDPPQHYLTSVKKIKEYILDGDVFQVNLSRKWQMDINQSEHNKLAALLYEQLRKNNPAPFSALVHIMENSIISSSPERLVKVKNNIIESRPIAGTRPRGKTPQLDQQLIQQLHDHPKEQSEHVMLIDLIRNDLGRVCVPGSIHVNEFMVNESYQHVHHIVSNVLGKLADNIKPGDVISAIFPGGTITGCPKVRCMEIIAELEQSARGAYTGSLGYINNDGSMDLNILIRTMVLEQNKNKQCLSLRAGAGIVTDSNPDKELLETYAKAKGLLKSIINN